VRGVGRLSLARLVRSASTSELGRRYWRGRRAGGALEAVVDGKAASTTKEAAGSLLQQSLRRAVAWRRTKAGRSGRRLTLGVEVYSERRSGVGEHSAAVAVKRKRKVRLAATLRRRGPARGAASGAAAACAARGGRKACGARRSGSWRSRHAALAVWRFDTLSGRRQARASWEEARWAGPVQASVASAGNKTKTGPH
jgi:hypothetical protein